MQFKFKWILAAAGAALMLSGCFFPPHGHGGHGGPDGGGYRQGGNSDHGGRDSYRGRDRDDDRGGRGGPGFNSSRY